ncbi:YraN family protein [Planctomycetota bacterium]|nr:YraN family protein [Planctomycetota bacterium]
MKRKAALRSRQFGSWAERYAAIRLRCRGWQILAKNLKTPYGEVDLLCNDGRGLVVVEVKYRSSHQFPSLRGDQQRRLERAACWIQLRERRLKRLSPQKNRADLHSGIRIDLVEIRGGGMFPRFSRRALSFSEMTYRNEESDEGAR